MKSILLQILALVFMAGVFALIITIADGYHMNGRMLGFWEVVMCIYAVLFTIGAMYTAHASTLIRSK